jgi:hypothetical protein
MKMLDFVWFEDPALHIIDISHTPEHKIALEARYTRARHGREHDEQSYLRPVEYMKNKRYPWPIQHSDLDWANIDFK